MDFESKEVQFYYVYKSLAHPGWNNYVRPKNLQDRLLHVAEAEKTLGTKIPWLCDDLTNSFSQALGGAPNSDFVIDPEGKIVSRHGWNRPEVLRAQLEELVGEVDSQVDPKSLGLPAFRPKKVQANVVAQADPPEDSMEIQVLALDTASNEPHYVKLRAEVNLDMVVDWEGELYLDFRLDPVHHVHWNNLQDPVSVRFVADPSIEFEPAELLGPKVDAESDSDPRSFKIYVKNWIPGTAIKAEATYLICDDANTWCKAITRQFVLACESARGSGIRLAKEKESTVYEYLRFEEEGFPEQVNKATPEQIENALGDWAMATKVNEHTKRWELHLSEQDGKIVGWSNLEPERPEVNITFFDGKRLEFYQLVGPVGERIVLEVGAGKAKGTHFSIFGDEKITGEQVNAASQPEEE